MGFDRQTKQQRARNTKREARRTGSSNSFDVVNTKVKPIRPMLTVNKSHSVSLYFTHSTHYKSSNAYVSRI